MEMDALNKKYENVRFVWTLHITHYNIRTDTTYFRASSRYYGTSRTKRSRSSLTART